MLVQRPQLWDSRLSASLLGSTGVPPMAAFCSLAGCRRKPGSSVLSSQPAGMVTAKETGPAWRTAGPLAREEPCVQARESQEVVPPPQPRGTRKAPIYHVILCKSLPHRVSPLIWTLELTELYTFSGLFYLLVNV